MESHWENEVYAQGRQINRWPFDAVVAAVKRHVGRNSSHPIRALEIGCGTGNNLLFLAEEGYETFGLDLSPTAVSLAKDHLHTRGLNCDVRVSDLSKLPFDNDYFDVTLDRGCLSCIPYSRLPGIVAELHRVLRPGAVHLSFSLYGEAHPDRQLGEEIEPCTRSRFKGGKLAQSGLITFFNSDRIQTLFGCFELLEVRRHCRFDGDRIEHEEYSAVAWK